MTAKAHPVAEVRSELDKMTPEFRAVLPPELPVERFNRVVVTALQKNPDLAKADRRSLFAACMECATDGLLPDGKEAVLNVYKTKQPDGTWLAKVQYLPMIKGIRKTVMKSGLFSDWKANIIYQNDEYEIVLGLHEYIMHKPLLHGDRGKPVLVYSVAHFKDSSKPNWDWMTINEVNKIRSRSRAKDSGPWVTDEEEMVKKTMLRRHSKSLPLDATLEQVIQRDDRLYDLEPSYPVPAFAQIASLPVPRLPPAAEVSAAAGAHAPESAAHSPTDSGAPGIDLAFERGVADASAGVPERAMPKDFRNNKEMEEAYKRGRRAGMTRHLNDEVPFE